MPIRPENRDRYPKNWRKIREQILLRADDRCEGCGAKNRAMGVRDPQGTFHPMTVNEQIEAEKHGAKVIEIVLTIAHLDHTPENCDPENLRAWCQKCHNAYDAPMRAAGRKKRAAATRELFGAEGGERGEDQQEG